MAVDPRPGDPCPLCKRPLVDPEDQRLVAAHPVGGDFDFVGSGPVTLVCAKCGHQVHTRLRRTQYADGTPTSYD